ncbi:MAG: FAD-binding protein [Planctomycetaceae bacterium]|nr:FAD-binding protein [Planctomycetaceae bacterium]
MWDAGERNVAIVAAGLGGTPYVAAFNAVLPDSPHGDTPKQYTEDMLAAGYHLGNKAVVEGLGELTYECILLLERWGVEFSRLESGAYRLRHASGSSVPRSLCRTDMLIGLHVAETLRKALKDKGATFYDDTTCCGLTVKDGAIAGITCQAKDGNVFALTSPRVLAAWGGVGNLYTRSTYPADVDGRTLAMAYDAGVNLIDLEFVEFEPMVSYEPPGAVGEPCPTAMLGEGAYLLNKDGERFLLKVRPQGEAGAPKSLINDAIREEVKAGRGGPLGGVFVDLRHIDLAVLKAYPWFYERELKAGLDVKTSLLQVGPMAHSHSGGMEIGPDCMTNIRGLYAAGEAAGGMHGACRMAGNAATQAAVSGLAAAKAMAELQVQAPEPITPAAIKSNPGVRKSVAPAIREVVTRAVERERDAAGLQAALTSLKDLAKQAKEDTFTAQLAECGILLATAALKREESRGTHLRTDFPEKKDEWRCSVRIRREGDEMRVETVAR